MSGDAPTGRTDPRPESHLAWEELQRLLAFKEGGAAKAPPEGRPLVHRYLWSPGVLRDITCRGCGSGGCNRCAGRGVMAEAFRDAGGGRPSVSAGGFLPGALRRLVAALGRPGARAR